MKNTILIIVSVLLLCPTLLRAQQPEDGVARHAVKVNILSPFVGSPSISYEFRIANHSAVQVDCGGTIFKSFDKDMTPHYYFADAHYRFYVVKQLDAFPGRGYTLHQRVGTLQHVCAQRRMGHCYRTLHKAR